MTKEGRRREIRTSNFKALRAERSAAAPAGSLQIVIKTMRAAIARLHGGPKFPACADAPTLMALLSDHLDGKNPTEPFQTEIASGICVHSHDITGQEGGNTRVAGQGYLNTSSIEKAITYLHALCGPYRVPDPTARVWAGVSRP